MACIAFVNSIRMVRASGWMGWPKTSPPTRARAPSRSLVWFTATALVTLAVVCSCGGGVQANPKLTVLFPFKTIRGISPSSLIADSAGNLYGAAVEGGAHGQGAVFELTPPPVGTTRWTETVLFSFNYADGAYPNASLVLDGSGNLYGTTSGGGLGGGCTGGCGLVFELKPPREGKEHWTEKVLFSFNAAIGSDPGTLIADAAGNLYGTAAGGGPGSSGLVFELSPPAAGETDWSETAIQTFDGNDGSDPRGAMISDGAGNLYGTTIAGGKSNDCDEGCGVVFELSPPAEGNTAWTETVLHSFDGTDGAAPWGGVIFDSAGNLYGTTTVGGEAADGVVFKLSPPKPGRTRWTETVLFSFSGTNGATSDASLLTDGAGNLFGTTYEGGANDKGVVFELAPPALGKTAWTETVIWSFCSKFNCRDGANPYSNLIADGAGRLYGTTPLDGEKGGGAAFKLTP